MKRPKEIIKNNNVKKHKSQDWAIENIGNQTDKEYSPEIAVNLIFNEIPIEPIHAPLPPQLWQEDASGGFVALHVDKSNALATPIKIITDNDAIIIQTTRNLVVKLPFSSNIFIE